MQIRYIGGKSSISLKIKDDNKPLSLRSSFDAWAYSNILYIPEEFSSAYNYYSYFLKNKYDKCPKYNSQIQHINEPVLYLYHPHNSNYSHFTLQVLSGYLAAKQMGLLGKGLKIAIDQSVGFQKQLSKIFGIDCDSIITLHPDILYTFSIVFYYTSLFSGDLDTFTMYLFEKFVPDFRSKYPQKLYITREGGIRNIVNNDDVKNLLKKRGFEIFDFAKIPVYEQIGLIQSVPFICALHGASGANLVFKNKDKFRFIELFSSSWQNSCHALILKTKNCDYTPVLCQASETGFHSPMIVSLNDLNQALDEVVHTFEFSSIDEGLASSSVERFLMQHSKLLDQFDKFSTNMNFDKFILNADYIGIINILKGCSLENMPPNLLRLFYFSAFLTFEKNEFFKLTNSIMKININSIIEQIIDFNYKIGNLNKVNEALAILKLIDPSKSYQQFNSFLDNNRYSSSIGMPIMTWHNVFCSINDSSNLLIQQDTSKNAIELRKDSGAYALFVPSQQKYIHSINSDLTCVLLDTPNPSLLNFYNQWNFSIISNGMYLSASNDKKSFKNEYVAREWERYFITTAEY